MLARPRARASSPGRDGEPLHLPEDVQLRQWTREGTDLGRPRQVGALRVEG